jgi:predicted ABC-type ATPase
MEEPVVIMVAGPNGAGKSSIAPGLLKQALTVVEYVNADVIARGISGFNPEGAALAAGRIMLQRLDELAAERQSFAFETTGASRSFAPRIRALKSRGYSFLAAYVWVDSPDVSVDRVARRVALGGHNVPEEVIRRRYERGLVNFLDLYCALADEWRFFDNTAPGDAILVAEGQGNSPAVVYGAEVWRSVIQMAAKARAEG